MSLDAAAFRNLLSRHDFAMVDRQAFDSEPWHEALPMTVLIPKELPDDEEKMPGLLTLSELTDEQHERLFANLQAARERREVRLISCLLAVTGDPNRVALHMTRTLVMHTPTDRYLGRYFLRYFDPRVFVHLERIFPPTLLLHLYGPVVQWTIPFQDDWITLLPPELPIWRKYWAMDAAQRQAVGRILRVNRVLTYWARNHGQWKNLDDFRAAAARVDRALERAANAYGMSSNDDLVAFALHALTHGDDFYLRPAIARLLQAVQQDKTIYYADEARSLTNEDWSAAHS